MHHRVTKYDTGLTTPYCIQDIKYVLEETNGSILGDPVTDHQEQPKPNPKSLDLIP